MALRGDGRPGGHTNTVDVEVDGATHAVDASFIVYNERTYPGSTGLLRELAVETKDSETSFGVSDDRTGLEWRGTSLSSLFAQRRNVTNPAFQRMLVDVVRFNRAARDIAATGEDPELTLGECATSRRRRRNRMAWRASWCSPSSSTVCSASTATSTSGSPGSIVSRTSGRCTSVPRAMQATGEVQGVFASRSPLRPNRSDSALVRAFGVVGNVVTVQGIDVADGTPLLDIKPWFADCDDPRRPTDRPT